MVDYLDELGRLLGILLGYLGVHEVHGLEAAFCVIGVTLCLGLCAAVRSAVRIAFLNGSARR